MPLNKQPLQIPLGGGIQTDVDPKILPLGKVTELENAQWTRQGEIVKRFGGNKLPIALTPGTGALGTAWQLATHKGALVQLGAQGSTSIATYSPAAQGWAFHDFSGAVANSSLQSNITAPLVLARLPVTNGGQNAEAGAPDVSATAQYYFEACEKGTSCAFSVIDVATGHVVYELFQLNAARPRSVVCNGYVIFTYNDTVANAISGFTALISTMASAGFTARPSFIAAVHASAPYVDVVVKDSLTISIVARSASNKTLAADYVPATNTTTNYEIKDGGTTSINPLYCLGWVQDLGGSGKLGIAICNATPAVNVYFDITVTGGVGTPAHTYAIDTAPGVLVRDLTAYTISSNAAGDVVVLYHVTATNTFDSKIQYGFRTASGTFPGGGSGLVLDRSVALVSKVFASGGRYYFLAAYDSPQQSTYYLFEAPQIVITTAICTAGSQARVCVWNGAGKVSKQSQPTSVWPVGSSFVMAVAEAGKLQAIGGEGEHPDIGITLVTFRPSPLLGSAAEGADSLFVPGGNLNAFDGRTFTEAGFAVYPETVQCTQVAGGDQAAGTYWYMAVYAYADAQGRWWRSAPSAVNPAVAGAGTLVNAGGMAGVLVAPTLRITSRPDVFVEFYRGFVGQTAELLKIAQVRNDPTVDTVTWTDGESDAEIAGGEPLYTTGGVLQNDTIPGALATCMFAQRVCFVSADNPEIVWYSDELRPGQGPRFSEEQIISFEDERGALQALTALDSALVAFKADAIYATSGDGADVLGNGSFAVPARIALGMGTTNPLGVVTTREGIMFRSTSQRAGIFSIDRGQSLQYVGSPVQKYNGETIVGAIVVASQSHVRFYTASGRTLVFDQVAQQWSTFTGQAAVGAAYWNGGPLYASPGAFVVQEDQTGATYTEAGVPYGMVVATPWLQLSSLRGYERFYRMQGVGETAGSHGLGVYVYKDFDMTKLLTPPEFMVPGPLWDWEMRYSAKVAGLRIKLVENSTTAGPKITALAMVWGQRPGLGKLPAANRTT